MVSAIAKFLLKLLGWKVVGDHRNDIKKKLIIAAPHTSNWDFPLGLLVRAAINSPVKYIGKPSLFKPPMSWIMYPLGGIPVVEHKDQSFVQNVVDMFDESEELTILIAPEGQRKKIHNFKTGFYYIAHGANIPILPAVIDFAKKEFQFLDLVYTQGQAKEEIAKIENLFRGVKGYRKSDSF